MAYNFRERFAGLLPGGFWPSWISQTPFTDFHQLDLDWILRAMKTVLDQMKYYFIDGGSKETIEEVMEEHPEWWPRVQDGAITTQKLDNTLKSKVSKIITNFDEFKDAINDSNQNVSYVCSEITINEPITISAIMQCVRKSFSNAVFILNDDMFTWDVPTYAALPNFVNCTFIGNGHNVVKSGKYITRGKFVNCNFVDCAFSTSATFVQSARFVNCLISNTTVPFINANRVYDTRFIGCQSESDNTKPWVQATTEQTNILSVSQLAISNAVIESQISNIIEMKDGEVTLDNIYSENISGNIVKVNTSNFSTAPFIKIQLLNSRVQSVNGNPAVHVNSDYENSPRSSFVCRNCQLSNTLVNTNKFKKYIIENLTAETQTSIAGKILPAIENSKLYPYKNSIADFTPGTHVYVKRWPCLLTYTAMNDAAGKPEPWLYFVGSVEQSGVEKPFVVCLSDPSKTPTATYDETNNYIDVTLHRSRYSLDYTGAVLLTGVSNNLNENDYWIANYDGYSV